MKALAAARCTHQRRGSANYFLVGTVSVIKALCGGAAGADPSRPARPPGQQPEQEAAACPHPHHFTLSHRTLTALFSLWHSPFPGGVRTGQAAVAGTSALGRHCRLPARQIPHEQAQTLRAPSPEHPARRGGWGLRGTEPSFCWEMSFLPLPFAVVRLLQPKREELLVAHPEQFSRS